MNDDMKNLLDETINVLKSGSKTPNDVRFVSINGKYCGSWDEFAELVKDLEYDPGYGGAEVNTALKVVGDDFWLERGEYDGSEWWEFKRLPIKPASAKPLTLSAINKECGGWYDDE